MSESKVMADLLSACNSKMTLIFVLHMGSWNWKCLNLW